MAIHVTKQVQKNYFISYELSYQVWCNIKWLLSFLKITSAILCKPIYDTINYSHSICPFESGKFWKEAKKLQKFKYLKDEKSFLDEIKKTFHVFEGLSFDEKINIW